MRREALCIHSPPVPPSSHPFCLFSCVFSCLLQLEAHSLVVHEERVFFERPQRMPGTGGGHSVIDCRDLRPAPGTGRVAPRPSGYSGVSATASYSSIAMHALFFRGESSRPKLSDLLYMGCLGVAGMISLTFRTALREKLRANSWNDATANQADSWRGRKLLTEGFRHWLGSSLKQRLIKTAYDGATECFIDLAGEWET